MNNLKQIRQRQQMAHARLLHLKADVLQGISTQPKKATELVAIGVCVVVECRSCLEWHVARAARSGASFEEVLDAVEAGIEVSGGRAAISARSATVVMDEVFGGSAAGVREGGFDATRSEIIERAGGGKQKRRTVSSFAFVS